ncbi:hypothetical protein Tco_1564670 [Tanacetum coccineum]
MTTSKLPSLIGIRSISKVVSSIIGRILSIEARDMDTKLLSAPESNNTLARCWFRRNVPVTTFGSRHDKLLILVADCFQWLVLCFCSFCWGGSIRPEGFLSSILLLAVIIVAVAIVVVVVLVVVDAIIGVVVVVSGVPSIIKLSFVIIGSLHRIVLCYMIHQPLSYGNGFLQSLRLRGGNISFNTSG